MIKMVFENNEEFNMDLYNQEFSYLIQCNINTVILVKTSEDAKKNLQGDILGITTNSFPKKYFYVDLSIMSDTNRIKQLRKEGYTGAGLRVFNIYFTKELQDRYNVNNTDLIIYKGGKYAIELKGQAEKSGQDGFVYGELKNLGNVTLEKTEKIMPGYLLEEAGGKILLC